MKLLVDSDAYENWKSKLLQELPLSVQCPQCEGEGRGECPHCGNDTDCDFCNGGGTVRTSELLTVEYYKRVMLFEKAKLEKWVNGEALLLGTVSEPIYVPHNPLDELLDQKPSSNSIAKIVLFVEAG